jgi:acyl-CoA synthetase (NDP forming)
VSVAALAPRQPHALEALLAPRSVALVGASDNPARIGGRPLRYLREAGFAGAVYAINPNRKAVQGYPAFPSLAQLPEPPDVAILAVPAAATVAALKDCVARGTKAAIIFSAGFAETGEAGRARQEEIARLARAGGLRVLGPNCLGVFNAALGYYGTFSAVLDGELMKPGPIAIVSQSGAYGSHLAHLARQRGLGVGHWITTGNECDIDLAETLRWVVEQPDVKVVMAYAEGVRDGDGFRAALETARRSGKAVVFVKVGRSEVGAEAASSHTAALAGSDAVFDAVFRQYGVWRARTTAEQIDVAYACTRGRYPAGDKIGIFTLSGGFGIQMADDATQSGLDVAPMPAATQDEMRALLPYASPRNPVDATAQALTDLPVMTTYLKAMLDKGGYDMFAGIFGSGPASPTFASALRSTLEEAASGRHDCLLSLTMSAPTGIVRTYEEKGFLVFEDGAALINALAALVHFRRSFDLSANAPIETLEACRFECSSRALSEYEAKSILARAGIAFPREVLVCPGEDAGAIAAQTGFPVAMKVSSPDIAHKTEIGGVMLGVATADEARQATTALMANARSKCPHARLDGILVSPMVRDGVETIAGVVRDPVFGPVVMFGLGGVFVEILEDVTFRAAPFGIGEAQRMIREIRGFAMLEGVRGAPPADVDALAGLLACLSRFAAANADTIQSIDLNPVRVMPKGQGVVPLDALIVPRIEGGRIKGGLG